MNATTDPTSASAFGSATGSKEVTLPLEDVITGMKSRITNLEKTILLQAEGTLSHRESIVLTTLGVIACALGYYGLGSPNHWYQPLFAGLFTLAFYSSDRIRLSNDWSRFLLPLLLFVVLCLLLKIPLGGGSPRPLAWMSFPVIEGGLTSGFKLSWQTSTLGLIELPLSVVQSFFLIMVAACVFLELEILGSLFFLGTILLSVPTLISLDWNWALAGIISCIFFILAYVKASATPLPNE